VRSREDFKQEKDEESRKIFGVVKRFYSRRRYLGKEGKPEECRRVDRRI